ncbi:MAG: hypothetical protein Q8M76_00525 [Spirochaetaceae bacterium]|nr:hypothetical protein [Spirochaetaceae bacterium]
MKPRFLGTAIGSMPFSDPDYAAKLSLERLPEAPIWPQLPRLGIREQMEVQYSEGMPCVVIDHEKKRMFIDTAQDYSEAFAGFYESYMAAMDPETGNGDCSAMAIGPAFSQGIPALEKALRSRGAKLPYVKVQTTGPCSFALTIVDEGKRAIYYNEEFRDVIVKALAMKCRWQIQKFKPYAENVICFIDEPILSAFGSSTYVSVRREDVVSLLSEMIAAVHADGAIAGIHCCGNTEWSILVDAGVDVINFDAYDYGETISMYAEHMKRHLGRGGALAWGVVPTSTAIREASVESLEVRLEKVMDKLSAQGLDKRVIVERSIITPSCGTGSMESADAEKVFRMTFELSKRMKAKYGF